MPMGDILLRQDISTPELAGEPGCENRIQMGKDSKKEIYNIVITKTK